MALTLADELRMRDVGLVDFYEQDKESWRAMVRDARRYMHAGFPADTPVRPDDVAKALMPLLEVDNSFIDFRNGKKLRQKLWIRIFADLLIDRTLDSIAAENQNGED